MFVCFNRTSQNKSDHVTCSSKSFKTINVKIRDSTSTIHRQYSLEWSLLTKGRVIMKMI